MVTVCNRKISTLMLFHLMEMQFGVVWGSAENIQSVVFVLLIKPIDIRK